MVKALARYRAKVPECYDEPLHDVIERVARTGSIGKVDIGALYFWKRIQLGRWNEPLLKAPEATVRGITATAVEAARNRSLSVPEAAAAAKVALSPLPGMKTGGALPSALILAAAPHRMAVYDKRARKGLADVCLPLSDGPARYRRYMELIEQCRVEMAEHGAGIYTAREVDLALYWLGG
ncbi:hypothetical protein KBX50_30310 [Micromonospora sp. C51]|nr:hypothetical protein [Micromonospora sp. C51]